MESEGGTGGRCGGSELGLVQTETRDQLQEREQYSYCPTEGHW